MTKRLENFVLGRSEPKLYYGVWKTYLYQAAVFAIMFLAPSVFAQNAKDATYPNPIQANDFATLIQSIATAVIKVGAPLAVLALIFAGFKFITGSLSGDTKAITDAKKIFWWTLIGAAVIVGAWAIATAVVNFAKTI